jgi:hypothetical protein
LLVPLVGNVISPFVFLISSFTTSNPLCISSLLLILFIL